LTSSFFKPFITFFCEKKEAIMAEKGGLRDLVWIRDKDGKEYACSVEALKGNIKKKEELTEEEKARCTDVSSMVGTERW
jgi:predicted GIY-YIG superfamily endonuclease